MSQAADRWLRRGALALTLALTSSLTATVVVVAWPRVSRAMGVTPPPPEPAYRAGQPVDVPTDWIDGRDITVVLFAQSGCGACQKAGPFFVELINSVRNRAGFVLATHGRDEDERFYAKSLGVSDESIRATPEGARVRLTPTLLVVQRDGRILHVWEGVGPEQQQKAIRNTILSAIN